VGITNAPEPRRPRVSNKRRCQHMSRPSPSRR
jgi:hypothetical protein